MHAAIPSVILSHYQVAPLLATHARGETSADTSPDLGLTQVGVILDAGGIGFPGGERLSWADAVEIAEDAVGCYAVEGDAIRKIQAFSRRTRRQVSLMPTAGAPTLLIAGFPMHRIKGTDPRQDTLTKIKTIAPVTGSVLDTSMGLGYTAIQAARTADTVLTIELDPGVIDVAAQNPWSSELFTHPRITRMQGDAAALIQEMDDALFTRILHDPPTIQLAGDLYSGAFYRELYRVLKRSGRLFHYIGDPNSAHGARYTPGIMRRLEAAGFRGVSKRPEAFGVVGYK
jgi:hypothetical protein